MSPQEDTDAVLRASVMTSRIQAGDLTDAERTELAELVWAATAVMYDVTDRPGDQKWAASSWQPVGGQLMRLLHAGAGGPEPGPRSSSVEPDGCPGPLEPARLARGLVVAVVAMGLFAAVAIALGAGWAPWR